MKSKGIFITIFLTMILIIISSTCVNANYYVFDSLPVIFPLSTNTASKIGWNVSFNNVSAVVSIFKDSNTLSTKCYLYDNTPTQLINGNFVGDNCTFSTPYNVSNNVSYFIEIDDIGNIYTFRYNSLTFAPYNLENINFISPVANENPNVWEWSPSNITTIVYDTTPIVCIESWIQNDTVCNGQNYTINFYDENNCGTILDLPFTNGTLIDCSCLASWSQDIKPCVNGVRSVTYTDINNCLNSTVPLQNGTNEYCSLVPVVDNTQYIIFIALAIFLLISFVGAIMLHEAFFGMCALITAFMMTTFIYYKYPVVLAVLCAFMILLFTIMWVVIGRAKR
jgi:hypothetical protein